MSDPTIQPCPDCCARPGQLHTPGCDCERCPRCGGQIIWCGCIYEVNDMSRQRLEQDHPDVYFGGPNQAMRERWQAEWGEWRLPWTGEWPGEAEAREYGFYCYWNGRWTRCSADHPGARPDLTRLIEECRWDSEQQRWVRREENQP
jgi:hypothetical protein